MSCENCYYTKEHEWVKLDGTAATIGITDHAQEALGDVTFVELPAVGKTIARQEPLCTVESSKAASNVYAPLGGTVTEVNDALTAEPERINQDCLGEGWMCKMQVANPDDIKTLMTAQQYEDYLKGL